MFIYLFEKHTMLKQRVHRQVVSTYRSYVSSAIILLMTIVANGCTEDNPNQPIDDHELITGVTLSFISVTNDTLQFRWRDIDGRDGILPAVVDTIALAAGTVYAASVRLLATYNSIEEDMTSSILAERNQHQFVVTERHGLLTMTPTDKDQYGKPVGLQSTATTGSTKGYGTLSVILYHYENETDKVPGVPGSEADVSVEFPIVLR